MSGGYSENVNGFESSFFIVVPNAFEEAGEDVVDVAGDRFTGESDEGTVKVNAFRFVAVLFVPSVSLPACAFDCCTESFLGPGAALPLDSASELDVSSAFKIAFRRSALGALGVDMLLRGCIAFCRSS